MVAHPCDVVQKFFNSLRQHSKTAFLSAGILCGAGCRALKEDAFSKMSLHVGTKYLGYQAAILLVTYITYAIYHATRKAFPTTKASIVESWGSIGADLNDSLWVGWSNSS